MRYSDILSDKFKNIIDIRLPQEWAQTGVLENSKLLTFFDEFGNINPNFLPTISSEFAKNDEIILICRTAHRTKFAIEYLKFNGFENVCDIDGGIFELIRLGVSLKKFEL